MRLAALIWLLPLAVAAWFSIHLAAADAQFQRRTPESVARAIAIEPGNTDYLAFRALQLDYDGADSTPLLERAAQLSPLSTAPRIRLGLAAEIRGDFDSAEKWLLEAARVDRQFEPRWTLANFYFRRANWERSEEQDLSKYSHPDGRGLKESAEHNRSLTVAAQKPGGEPLWNQSAERSWNAMREALAISYGDRRPAFDLCWRMGEASSIDAASIDADTILDRAIPERREVLAAYLQYALESHPDAAGPVALKLASFGEPSDRALLLAACDRLMADANSSEHDAAFALRLWSAIGYAAPAGIFNGSFITPPVNHGFDWRLIESPGVVHTGLDQPRPAHRIAFDGREPESCALLMQIVNLEPHARYTLRWEARTSGFAMPTGIEWRIGDLRAPFQAMIQTTIQAGDALRASTPISVPASTSSSDARQATRSPAPPVSSGSAVFIAPSELVPLTLFYQRPSGQARAEGSIELSRVSIEKTP